MSLFTKKRIEAMILIGALGALAVFGGVVLTQKKFKATSDVLIVQNQQGSSDYYALYKSSEYLGKVLSESIYSEAFLNEMSAGGQVSLSDFLPEGKAEKLKQWKQITDARRNPDSGAITITVRSDNTKQASDISDAVVNVLTNKYQLFVGGGKEMEVRVLSGPVVEKNFSLAQLIGIVAAGFMFGGSLVFVWAFLYDSRVAPAKENIADASNEDSEEQFNAEEEHKVTSDQVAAVPVFLEEDFLREAEAVNYLKEEAMPVSSGAAVAEEAPVIAAVEAENEKQLQEKQENRVFAEEKIIESVKKVEAPEPAVIPQPVRQEPSLEKFIFMGKDFKNFNTPADAYTYQDNKKPAELNKYAKEEAAFLKDDNFADENFKWPGVSDIKY
jgi:capsular polysaccharide biosynthesis protein